MAIRSIVKKGDEALSKICRPVEKFDAHLCELLDDMAETMYEADGVGLAAPQVGIMRRVVTIDVGDGLIELINPEITEKSGSQVGMEGCLSIPGTYVEIERPYTVKVSAFDRNGSRFEIEGEEFLARAICHELDHLDGALMTDKGRILSEEEVEMIRSGQSIDE